MPVPPADIWRRLSPPQRAMLVSLERHGDDGYSFGGQREQTAMVLVRHGLVRKSENYSLSTLFKITDTGIALLSLRRSQGSIFTASGS